MTGLCVVGNSIIGKNEGMCVSFLFPKKSIDCGLYLVVAVGYQHTPSSIHRILRVWLKGWLRLYIKYKVN